MREKLKAEDEALLRAYEADNFRLYDRPTSGRHRAPTPPYRMKTTFAVMTALMVTVLAGSEQAHQTEEPAMASAPSGAVTERDLSVEATIASERITLRTIERAERSGRLAKVESQAKAALIVKRAPRPPSWVKPLDSYKLTSCYAPRWGTFHYGIDMSARSGTPIHSVGAGVVVQAGWRWSGYGLTIVVDHGGGWLTLYAHTSRALVKVGQQVAPGQNIALVGSTGFSTGPHLHFSVVRGALKGWPLGWVNPGPWLRDRGVEPGGC